jgi:hypothetical protein
MNHFFRVIAISLLMISCTDEFEQLDQPESLSQEDETKGNTRSVDEAIQLAIESKVKFYPTVSRSDVSVDKSQVKVIANHSSSRSDGRDTFFYVVNFEEGAGFALINAKKGGVDVYAITESGEYNPSSLENNTPPALNDYIKYAIAVNNEEYELNKEKSKADFTTVSFMQTKTVMDTTYTCVVNPIVKTRWGQNQFFGQLCPNKIAGCGPVAIGQALAALSIPTSMTFNVSDIPYDSATFDWSELTKHYVYSRTSNFCAYEGDANDNTSHIKIAAFLRELGYRSYANYKSSGTSTVLEKLRYTVNNIEGAKILNVSSTSFGCPIDTYKTTIFIGASWNVDDSGSYNYGHCWILDGCKFFKLTTATYERPDNLSQWTLTSTSTSDVKYYHVNWGWYGEANGYFYSSSSVNPKYGNNYDYPYLSIGYDINYNTFQYFGIYK